MQENKEIIRLFIGYDHREPIAYHVCVQSLMETSHYPLSITPLRLSNLKLIFERERGRNQLTDFSYTRFLVPYLCNYQGWAIFIDGDMLVREDIIQLWNFKNATHPVMVVKHPTFTGTHTFLSKTISHFPKFNWSSVMLFNNTLCTQLTPDYLKTANYHDLHQFTWLEDDTKIGELPNQWNYLVGYSDKPKENTAIVHWTLGGPYFGGEFEEHEYAEEWFAMRDKTFYCQK